MMYDNDKEMDLSFSDGICHVKYLEEIHVVQDGIARDVMVLKTLEDFELMEYAGLKDIKGKEIYEGDIARMYYQSTPHEIFGFGSVVFNGGCFLMEWIDDPEAEMDILGMDKRGRPTKLELIGNIYENKELLNQTSSNKEETK